MEMLMSSQDFDNMLALVKDASQASLVCGERRWSSDDYPEDEILWPFSNMVVTMGYRILALSYDRLEEDGGKKYKALRDRLDDDSFIPGDLAPEVLRRYRRLKWLRDTLGTRYGTEYAEDYSVLAIPFEAEENMKRLARVKAGFAGADEATLSKAGKIRAFFLRWRGAGVSKYMKGRGRDCVAFDEWGEEHLLAATGGADSTAE